MLSVAAVLFVAALVAPFLATPEALAEDLDRLGSEDSCQRGNANGCYNLGVDLYNAGNREQSKLHFEKSCRLGLAKSCTQLSRVFWGHPKAKSGMPARSAEAALWSYVWSSRAVELGDSAAASIKADSLRMLTPEALVKAEGLLAEIRAPRKNGAPSATAQ